MAVPVAYSQRNTPNNPFYQTEHHIRVPKRAQSKWWLDTRFFAPNQEEGPFAPFPVNFIIDVDVIAGTIATRDASVCVVGTGIVYSMSVDNVWPVAGWDIDSVTGAITIPTGTPFAAKNVVVVADNGTPPAAILPFEVVVREVPASPLAVGRIDDVNVLEDAAVTPQRTASGVFTGANLVYSMAFIDGPLTAGFSINSSSGLIVIPTADPYTTKTLVVTADNGIPPSASVTFTATVTSATPPPVNIAPIADVSVVQNDAVTRNATFAFSGPSLVYTMKVDGVASPTGGFSIHSSTGVITIPTSLPYLSKTLEVTATNVAGVAVTSFFCEVADDGRVEATGGTSDDVQIIGVPYKLHTFGSSGDFIVTDPGLVDVLIIGAGGAGGAARGGGGGAGGFVKQMSLFLDAGTYPIEVGAGGDGVAGLAGAAGAQSSAFDLIAFGGGGGGNGPTPSTGGNGASGGGGGGAGNAATPNGGTAQQGFAGGKGMGIGSPSSQRHGGGGGGAGAVGTNATTAIAGNGGVGITDDFSGTSLGYCGGGGGAGNTAHGTGTTGGGNGGTAGTAATTPGSGGGGSNVVTTGVGGSGSDGVVMIRYAAPAPAGVAPVKLGDFIANVDVNPNEVAVRSAASCFSGTGIVYSMTVGGIWPVAGWAIDSNGAITIPTATPFTIKTVVVTAANGTAPDATTSFTAVVNPAMAAGTAPTFTAAVPPGTALGSVLNISQGTVTGGDLPRTREYQVLRNGVGLGWGASSAYTVQAADQGKTLTAQVRTRDASTPYQEVIQNATGSFVIPSSITYDATVTTTAQLQTAMTNACAVAGDYRILIPGGTILTGSIVVNMVKNGTSHVAGDPQGTRALITTDPANPAILRSTVAGTGYFDMTNFGGFTLDGLKFENLRKDGVNAGNSTSLNSVYGGNAGYPAADAKCMDTSKFSNMLIIGCEFKGHHRCCAMQDANNVEWAYCRFRQIGMDCIVHFGDVPTDVWIHHCVFDEVDIDAARANSDNPNRHSDACSMQSDGSLRTTVEYCHFDGTTANCYWQNIFWSNPKGIANNNANALAQAHVEATFRGNIMMNNHANQHFMSCMKDCLSEDNRGYRTNFAQDGVNTSAPRTKLQGKWFGTNVIRNNQWAGLNTAELAESGAGNPTLTGNVTNATRVTWAQIPNKPPAGPGAR
jgi:hypothetical protein